MNKDLWSKQRFVLLGVGLIGVVLALTWVVLYLNAGASSAGAGTGTLYDNAR